MILILDVARKGSGKTYRSLKWANYFESKRHIENKYVVDPERQYVKHTQFMQVHPEKDIIPFLKTIRDSFTIIDCANYYFPLAAQNSELERILGGTRNRGNIIWMNFHSLRKVPAYIRDQTDMMILGHTEDQEDVLKRYGYKNEKLKEKFLELRKPENSWEKRKHMCFVI